jgi:signal transduction histidine kinase
MTDPVTTWPLMAMSLASHNDVVAVRAHTRRLAGAIGFDAHDQVRIAAAVSEIARNAVSHAGGGQLECAIDAGGPAQCLVVSVSDCGHGIADLAAVWAGGERSGLIAARRLMDTLDVVTAPGSGTRVSLRKALPRRAAPLTSAGVANVAEALAREAPRDPTAELREQSRELILALAEQRRQQDELRALNRELEETNRGVLALYAELEDKAVAVRQASEAKSRFLSNVSHELRTPIQSVLAIGRLLLDHVDGELTPEQERQVRFIYESARTLSGLVDDLLDLAKVEAGKMDLRLRLFDAADLLGGLRGLLKPLHINPAVKLVFDDPPTRADGRGLHLFSDEGKIAQILRNLLANALKFTPSGEVRVLVHHDEASGDVSFAVADTGIGIAPRDQERIFEEFEQVANPLQRQGAGTGLGLPLARRLAQLLGGTVTVASAPQHGATFTLRLPRRFSTLTQSAGSADQATIRLEGAQRALVIDDDAGWGYVVAQAARARGLTVHVTADVAAGLQHAKECAPDVIFLDLAMPGIDGYEVLDRLHSDPATRDIPAVIVSGSAPPRGERHSLGHALAILPKSSELREAVESLLAGSMSHA